MAKATAVPWSLGGVFMANPAMDAADILRTDGAERAGLFASPAAPGGSAMPAP
jgi:hypothetical protein